MHVACGTDRLGFIDVAYGLTTILTDVDSASLDILAQQFASLQPSAVLSPARCSAVSSL